jgi:hypothetical protein
VTEEVQKKRSPWVYVGIGCLAITIFGCLGSLIGMKLVCGGMKQWAEDLNDQQKQEQKARAAAEESLGGVPVGYYPVFTFGIPFVFDMIVFVDHPPQPDAAITFDRLFYFQRVIETDNTNRIQEYFEGKGDAEALKGAQIDAKQELARGELTHQERKVRWIAARGRIQTQGPYERGEDGIINAMLFDCPKDGKMRIAMWQMRDEGQTELKGTVADPEELQKLLTGLSPCGK